MRLNRYLAQCGVASRRGADELISAGRVRINGKIITNLGTQVDEAGDRVEFNGREVRPAEKQIHIVLNKPPGCDVTRNDPHSPKSVFDYLPASLPASVQYVGRLDRATTGLLIFTNDGELANRLAHPSHGVEKEYLCFGPAAPTREQIEQLMSIVNLEDGPARAKRADVVLASLPPGLGSSMPHVAPLALRVVIHLGRKRIVRRMCEAVGYKLVHLHRTRVGRLELGRLEMGAHRKLSAAEVRDIERSATK